MKQFVVVAAFLLTAATLNAQVVDSAKLLVKYVPKLSNFTKINEQAEIKDTAQEKVTYTYIVSPQKPELGFNPSEMKVSKVNPEVMERFYRNYIKLGFGYPITPLAELSMHNTQSNKYSYGLNFHHFSSWAEPIDKIQKKFAYAPTSDSRVHLFFNRYFKNYTLYSSIGYNHELANLYGYNKDLGYDTLYYGKPYRDSIRNSFNHVKAEVGFRSNYTIEEKRLKEDVRVNYDFIHTYWKDMEHAVGLKTMWAYDARFLKISGYQHYQLDFDVDYYNNAWNDSVQRGGSQEMQMVHRVDNNYKIEFRPTMNFSIKEYHLLLGVGVPVVIENNASKPKCPVYPIAELQMGLIRGIMSLYVGVDGKTEYNSLNKILYENPYVKPQLDSLKFTKSQIRIYGGIKGNLVKKLNYHISANYAYTNSMPFYVLDTTSLLNNQFDIMYVDKVNVLNVCANISWEAIDHLYLNLNANYWGYYYKHLKMEHPWYKPSWEIAFDGKYVLNNKFIFDLNAKIGFDRWALAPRLKEDGSGMTYVPVNDIRKNFKDEMMKPVLHFGLGFEYLVSKQFTVFANINNIGYQYASTYYNFNNFGINVLAGVTYSFGNEPFKAPKKKKVK